MITCDHCKKASGGDDVRQYQLRISSVPGRDPLRVDLNLETSFDLCEACLAVVLGQLPGRLVTCEAKVPGPERPSLGDPARCLSCLKEIEYIGPHWRHADGSNPRHAAVPILQCAAPRAATRA